MSVDGTDCIIQEPHPFSSSWYSHKFHGPGLRYEIGLSISTGRIVWVNGPYKCGNFPDNKIFIDNMKNNLLPNEYVVADRGYTDNKCIGPDVSPCHFDVHRRTRARHETVNERLKNFNVVHHVFRHDLSKHADCFHAVAQITAIMIDTINPLFQI